MSILVTGSTGFIGQHLIDELNNLGKKIIVLVRPGSSIEYLNRLSNVTIYFGDLSDDNCINEMEKEIDCLYHLAVNWEKMSSRMDKEFVRKLLENGLKQVVYYSSVCAYGLDLNRNNLSESLPSSFLSNDKYGIYKHEVEQCLLDLKTTYNFQLHILRPTLVYGPGDFQTVYNLFNLIRKDKLFLYDNGKRGANPCYVKNLIKISIHLFQNESIEDGIYNVADNDNTTVFELTKEISLTMGFQFRYKNINSFLAYYKGFINFVFNKLELSKSEETHFSYNIWKRSYSIDLTKMKIITANLDLYQMREGLKESYSWYIDQNKL
jgi:nucleoside-diphosphate-sugar epimerase